MPGSTDVFASRILIVDDQQSNVRLLEFTLRRGGYLAVSSTTDPLAVCELHRQNRFALVLLDLQMPVMNGLQVLEALACLEGVERPSILVVSADPSQVLPCLEVGANGFISKPFVLTEVLQRVHLALEVEQVVPVMVPAA